MTPTAIHAQIPRGVRRGLTALSVVGLAGLLLTFWFGFEEPNSSLLWPSVAMLLAGPMAALVHLTSTRTLTAERKRVWWKEFGSAEIWSAFSEYLSSPDLGASADRRATQAERRRGLRRT
jgi:hypothetical protein